MGNNRRKHRESFLNELIKEVKKNVSPDNPIVLIENNEISEKMLSEIDRAYREKNKDLYLTKDFEKDFDIICCDGKYGIVTRHLSNTTIIPLLKSFKEREASTEINVIPTYFGDLFKHLKKEPKKIPSELSNTNKFTSHFLSLLTLSSEYNSLISSLKIRQALIIKSSIRTAYREEGVRFCNCYSRGYVEKFLQSLHGKTEKEIEEKMWDLSKMPIFFISVPFSYQDRNQVQLIDEEVQKIVSKLTSAMKNNAPYIAIHSLGNASSIAEKISVEILKQSIKGYGSVRIDRMDINGKRDFSYIWYNLEGKPLYELFKSLWS